MINQLSGFLFWDVDINAVSEETHAGWLIQRVCMRGTWEDLVLLKGFYGLEKIREVLLKARYLDKKTLSYFCALFNIEKENFRCYTLRQSTGIHWDY